MRPLRYSINVSLDGCVDHRTGVPDEELHQHATTLIESADAVVLGRVTYELMEGAWRAPSQTGVTPDGMPAWMMPFAHAIGSVDKYVVSDSLDPAAVADLDWSTRVVRVQDAVETVRELKARPGRGLYVGGARLPLLLAEHDLVDEYEFVVQPRLVGHGPTPFAGLSHVVELELVGRTDFSGGATALRYVPRR